jgi:hypothetical protein
VYESRTPRRFASSTGSRSSGDEIGSSFASLRLRQRRKQTTRRSCDARDDRVQARVEPEEVVAGARELLDGLRLREIDLAREAREQEAEREHVAQLVVMTERVLPGGVARQVGGAGHLVRPVGDRERADVDVARGDVEGDGRAVDDVERAAERPQQALDPRVLAPRRPAGGVGEPDAPVGDREPRQALELGDPAPLVAARIDACEPGRRLDEARDGDVELADDEQARPVGDDLRGEREAALALEVRGLRAGRSRTRSAFAPRSGTRRRRGGRGRSGRARARPPPRARPRRGAT